MIARAPVRLDVGPSRYRAWSAKLSLGEVGRGIAVANICFRYTCETVDLQDHRNVIVSAFVNVAGFMPFRAHH